MPFLDYLDPAEVHAGHHVNRERDLAWLRSGLLQALALPDRQHGRTWVITGDKGVGKSILTERVLADVRAQRSGDTAIVRVDCRRKATWRHVLQAFTDGLVEELVGLQQVAVARLRDELGPLLDSVRIAAALARMSEVEERVAQERVTQYGAAVKLGGEKRFLSAISTSFELSMSRSARHAQGLSGKITIDDDRLTAAIVELMRDALQIGVQVVVFFDNVDELDHRYGGDARDRVRRQVEGVLGLTTGPALCVLNLRTYFTGVLTRELTDRRRLKALPAEELRRVADQRLRPERPEVHAALARPEALAGLAALVERASTPLAMLQWLKFLFQEDLLDRPWAEGAQAWQEQNCGHHSPHVLGALLAAFPEPGAEVERAALLAACGGQDRLLLQMEDEQVVLPVDFWNPRAYTLDPVYQLLHPARRA